IACTSFRNWRRSASEIFQRSLPRKSTWPEVGGVKPRRIRARVVLPLPLSPATAVKEGVSSLMDSERSSSATLAFAPLPKIFVTFRSSIWVDIGTPVSVQVARNPAARANLLQIGNLHRTTAKGLFTARVEDAPAGRVEERGWR